MGYNIINTEIKSINIVENVDYLNRKVNVVLSDNRSYNFVIKNLKMDSIEFESAVNDNNSKLRRKIIKLIGFHQSISNSGLHKFKVLQKKNGETRIIKKYNGKSKIISELKCKKVIKNQIKSTKLEINKKIISQSIDKNKLLKSISNYNEFSFINKNEQLTILNKSLQTLKLFHNETDTIEVNNSKDIEDNYVVSIKTPWKPNLQGLTHRQQMIYNILRGNIPNLKEMRQDHDLLPAVLLKKNTILMNEARELVQKIFDDMSVQLQANGDMTDSENLHMEMIIGDILALYPFLRPEKNEILSFPVLINNKWQTIDYHVEELPLTSKWMGSPITAYGLISKDGPSHLLFKGTTYPTDKGFSLSLLTDINPFGRVGDYTFRIGRKKIKNWLEKNTSAEQKAIIVGKSLGGIQSCVTGIYFPDNIQKVNAYGAPGFTLADLKKINKLHNQGKLPDIRVFCQKNDPVPYSDWVAKKGIQYFHVFSSKIRKGVMAHADMYSTHEDSSILKWDPSTESSKIQRVAMTILRGGMSLFAFPFMASMHSIFTLVHKAIK